MPKSASFPYERVLTPIGFVWLPVARVEVTSGAACIALDMVVDTGADLTMVPYLVGRNLGFGRRRQAPLKLCGISGGAPYILEQVAIRIGPIALKARLAWAQTEEVPMLLGRTDVLERLVTIFDGKKRKVTFRG